MPKKCELLGIRPIVGNNVSHSHIRTSKKWSPNLQKKRYLVHELRQPVTVTLSTRAIRTIDKKGGLASAVLSVKEENLSPKLLKLLNKLKKSRGIGRPKVIAST